MNLIDNEELNAKNKKSKTIMIIIIVCIILLLCLSAALVYMIYNVQKNMLKLTIDTKQISTFSDDMFIFEDDTIYVSIRDFAKLVGYEVYNGDHTSEDSTKGYVKNEYEEASFTLNSDKMYKTLLAETDTESYSIAKPVKMQNDKLYISIDGIQIATTCAISYNANNNQFTVYTLPYLAKYYTGTFKNSAIGGKEPDFSNQKAILYNMVVVKNEDDKYGVIGIDNKEVIGTKYSSIKFIESTKEFIVTTDDKKMGIMSSTGETRISPSYDEIKQISEELNLYLVKNNNKYGVINRNENIIIHLEYDKIGVDISQFESNFSNNNMKNQYVLFDNCIPVQRNEKWGIYDKTGRLIIPIKYDELGCSSGTKNSNQYKSLLFIPDYEAIIVKEDEKYGLVNSLGEELIQSVLDSFYMATEAGQDSYYMTQGEKTYLVETYLEQQGIKKIHSAGNDVTINTETNNKANGNATQNTEVPANDTQTNMVANDEATQSTEVPANDTQTNMVANDETTQSTEVPTEATQTNTEINQESQATTN